MWLLRCTLPDMMGYSSRMAVLIEWTVGGIPYVVLVEYICRELLVTAEQKGDVQDTVAHAALTAMPPATSSQRR